MSKKNPCDEFVQPMRFPAKFAFHGEIKRLQIILQEIMDHYREDYIANSFVKITSDLIQIDKSHVHIYRRTCELLGSIWKCRCGEWRIFFPRLQHDNDTPFDWDRDKKLEGPKLGDTPF